MNSSVFNIWTGRNLCSETEGSQFHCLLRVKVRSTLSWLINSYKCKGLACKLVAVE